MLSPRLHLSRNITSTHLIKPHGNTFLGVVIGLFLGIAISLVAVYYVNKNMVTNASPGPAATNTVSPLGLPNPQANGVANSDNKPTEDTPAGKKKFDFFEILPGTDEGTASATKPGTKPTVKPADTTEDPASTPVATTRPNRVLLQVGAFQVQADAENLKGKLALLGVETMVRSKEIPDKGVWYRVISGPYSTADEAEKARTLLKNNGFTPTVIVMKADSNG